MLRVSLVSLLLVVSACSPDAETRSSESGPDVYVLTGEEPELDEVRSAVLAYFGDDDESERAHRSFEEWGDGALPGLRRLAKGELGAREELAIVFSITEETSEQSVDLLVEILKGETNVDQENALRVFRDSRPGGRVHGYVKLRDDFKPAVLRFADDPSWLNRSYFAEIAATMRWEDCIPLIEPMLSDENYSLRMDAAKALTELTGEEVAARGSELDLPGKQLCNGVLGSPELLAEFKRARGDFGADFSGSPCLLLSQGEQLDVFVVGDEPRETYSLNQHCAGALALADEEGTHYMLTLTSDSGNGTGDYVRAVDSRGESLWSFRPAKTRVGGMTALHTQRGVVGAVVQIGCQLFALNHEGELLWNHEGFTPSYALLSHPELPGVVYAMFGNLQRFECTAESCDSQQTIRRSGVYATEGVLFPDSEGKPAFILAGAGEGSTPTVVRVDEDGDQAWSATLPGKADGLVMIEAPGRPRIFALTVDSGQLLIVDENGVLLHEEELPEYYPHRRRSSRRLAAGQVSQGEWAIYLSMSHSSYLYPLDLSAL